MDTETDRQDAILDAAFGALAAYGYKRTTMEDIARAAGLSRTALYLHFRSKEDIFRSLTQRYFERALLAMEAALNSPGQSAEAALFAGFVAKGGKFIEVVLSTPHGAELLDAGYSCAPDVVEQGTRAFAAALARWLGARGLPASFGPAQDFAETIMAALAGIKSAARTVEDLRTKEALMARMVAQALD